jgi:hypothetical protein
MACGHSGYEKDARLARVGGLRGRRAQRAPPRACPTVEGSEWLV